MILILYKVELNISLVFYSFLALKTRFQMRPVFTWIAFYSTTMFLGSVVNGNS